MSRFGNLEFGSNNQKPQQTNEVRCDGAYHLKQAQDAFENGRFEQALRFYAKALEFNPADVTAWVGQVRALVELGEYAEARVWADKALGTFPDEAELLAAKSVALARDGDLAGALAFSDAAVETQAITPYIWLARADVLLARAEKRAEYCIEKALSLAQNHWVVLWLAARIQAYYKHVARSLKLIQQAVQLEPGRGVLWLQLGQCQLALGLAQQAANSFEQARELDPECETCEWERRAKNSSFLDKITGRWRQWLGR